MATNPATPISPAAAATNGVCAELGALVVELPLEPAEPLALLSLLLLSLLSLSPSPDFRFGLAVATIWPFEVLVVEKLAMPEEPPVASATNHAALPVTEGV